MCEHNLPIFDCKVCQPPLIGAGDTLTLQQFTDMLKEFYPAGKTASLEDFVRESKRHFDAAARAKEKQLKLLSKNK